MRESTSSIHASIWTHTEGSLDDWLCHAKRISELHLLFRCELLPSTELLDLRRKVNAGAAPHGLVPTLHDVVGSPG